jgi:hypothetical protein
MPSGASGPRTWRAAPTGRPRRAGSRTSSRAPSPRRPPPAEGALSKQSGQNSGGVWCARAALPLTTHRRAWREPRSCASRSCWSSPRVWGRRRSRHSGPAWQRVRLLVQGVPQTLKEAGGRGSVAGFGAVQEMEEPGCCWPGGRRGRRAGGGRRPSRAAAVTSRGGERRGKRRAGERCGSEGERKRTTDDLGLRAPSAARIA